MRKKIAVICVLVMILTVNVSYSSASYTVVTARPNGTPTATKKPTPLPSATPIPSATPYNTNSPAPSPTPSPLPTALPTPSPKASPHLHDITPPRINSPLPTLNTGNIAVTPQSTDIAETPTPTATVINVQKVDDQNEFTLSTFIKYLTYVVYAMSGVAVVFGIIRLIILLVCKKDIVPVRQRKYKKTYTVEAQKKQINKGKGKDISGSDKTTGET